MTEQALWRRVVYVAVGAVCLTMLLTAWLIRPPRFVHANGYLVLDRSSGELHPAYKHADQADAKP